MQSRFASGFNIQMEILLLNFIVLNKVCTNRFRATEDGKKLMQQHLQGRQCN